MDYFQVEIEKEDRSETMAFIESKRNRAEHKQLVSVSDCKIYWRGEFLIVEHNNLVEYWDSFPYCFLKQAVEFIQPERPARWKTLDKLIALRMAIRQTEVNGCGYVDNVLMGENMTLALYRHFMALARAQDLSHHGSYTF